jgi:hypothetical protein
MLAADVFVKSESSTGAKGAWSRAKTTIGSRSARSPSTGSAVHRPGVSASDFVHSAAMRSACACGKRPAHERSPQSLSATPR